MEIKKYLLGKMLELREKFLSSKNDVVDGGTPFRVTVTSKKVNKKKPYRWATARTKLLLPSELLAPLSAVGNVVSEGVNLLPGGEYINDYVFPALSIGNWIAGNGNPYRGAEIRANDERLLGAWLPFDFISPKIIGTGTKNIGGFVRRQMKAPKLIREGEQNARNYLNSGEYKNKVRLLEDENINDIVDLLISHADKAKTFYFPLPFSSKVGMAFSPEAYQGNFVLSKLPRFRWINTSNRFYPHIKEAATHEYFHSGSKGLDLVPALERNHYINASTRLKSNNSYMLEPDELRSFNLTGEVYGPLSMNRLLLLRFIGEDGVDKIRNYDYNWKEGELPYEKQGGKL